MDGSRRRIADEDLDRALAGLVAHEGPLDLRERVEAAIAPRDAQPSRGWRPATALAAAAGAALVGWMLWQRPVIEAPPREARVAPSREAPAGPGSGDPAAGSAPSSASVDAAASNVTAGPLVRPKTRDVPAPVRPRWQHELPALAGPAPIHVEAVRPAAIRVATLHVAPLEPIAALEPPPIDGTD